MEKLTITQAKKDPKLLNEFMSQNDKLVSFSLRNLRLSEEHKEEALQVARMTFYKCIVNFNEEYGDHFTTYCVTSMQYSVYKLFRDGYFHNIKPPRWYEQAKKLFKLEHSISEIATTLERTEAEIHQILTLMNCISLDTVLYDSENTKTTVYNLVEETNAIQEREEQVLITNFITSLKERDRQIFLMKYNGYTQCEIASYFNITQTQICRVLKRLKIKFKQYLQG